MSATPTYLTRIQARASITGPHVIRRRRWINALTLVAALAAAVAGVVVACAR